MTGFVPKNFINFSKFFTISEQNLIPLLSFLVQIFLKEVFLELFVKVTGSTIFIGLIPLTILGGDLGLDTTLIRLATPTATDRMLELNIIIVFGWQRCLNVSTALKKVNFK